MGSKWNNNVVYNGETSVVHDILRFVLELITKTPSALAEGVLIFASMRDINTYRPYRRPCRLPALQVRVP